MRDKSNMCPELTDAEMNALTRGTWSKDPSQSVTEVDYSFALTYDAALILSDRVRISGGSAVDLLTPEMQRVVQSHLTSWEDTCDNQIKFNHVPHLSNEGRGVIFVACENMTEAAGFAHFPPRYMRGNTLGLGLVCLPAFIRNMYDHHTVAHEIGHVIGVKGHPHDLERVAKLTRITPEGLGCTVMNYVDLVKTPENHCISSPNCHGEIYAITPGPMDAQMCRKLYPAPILPAVPYHEAVVSGLVATGLEPFLSTVLAETRSLQLNAETARKIALVCMIALRSYDDTLYSVSNMLSILELANSLYSASDIKLLAAFKNIRTVYAVVSALYNFVTTKDAQSSYLALYIAAALGGLAIAEPAGRKVAGVLNEVIDNPRSVLDLGASVVSSASRTMYSFFEPVAKVVTEVAASVCWSLLPKG